MFSDHLANKFGYAIAGRGYCTDHIALPEGKYPELLSINETLYDKDRIRECMTRCLDAVQEDTLGSQNNGGSLIGDKAFHIRDSDQRCGCSSGPCSSIRASLGYTSYYIQDGVSGKCVQNMYRFQKMG